ncbi:MAG: hypothetical protein IJZ29_05830 [Clostridia bacterium]|nr:hypothetical protein [Clostridia bacterium]
MIPVSSFAVANALVNDVYRAISFSILTAFCFSSPLMIYAYVRDFEKRYKPDLKDKYLTNEEITILNINAHLFKSDLNEIMDKAVMLKDLKIKRDARDISSCKYKDRVRNL